MHAREDHLLHITDRPGCVDIRVLKDCDIRWSEDTTTWYSMGSFNAGDVWNDQYTTPDRPRSYMARAEHGTSWVTHYHREAGLAFAELMEPWFPGDGLR